VIIASSFLSRRTAGRAGLLAALLVAGSAALAQTPAPASQDPNLIPWLARSLDRFKPSVDTSLPETPAEAATRIQGLLDRGQNAQALSELDAFTAKDEANRSRPGTNVQMLFLRGRALAQLGRRDDARALYADMTERFPELPETWNNLAALQLADGQLDLARDSLQMALRANPQYALAHENLGIVYLQLASRSLGQAGGGSQALKLQVDTLLRGQGR